MCSFHNEAVPVICFIELDIQLDDKCPCVILVFAVRAWCRRAALVPLDVCIKIIVFNRKFIISNTKSIILNANRYRDQIRGQADIVHLSLRVEMDVRSLLQ